MLIQVLLTFSKFYIFRVYIKDAERKQLSEQALSLCIQTLRTQIKNVTVANCNKFLGEVYRSYQRVQKNLEQKESIFAGMLTEVYKKFMGDKIPENANLLDLAVKYCQQNKIVEKQKRQMNVQPVPRAPIVTTAVSCNFIPSFSSKSYTL